MAMTIRRLSREFAVSPQLTAADMEEAARAGFTAIVNNRPDGETAGQPASSELEIAARRHGLQYRHIPIRGAGDLSDADIEAFRTAIAEMEGRVLAFCQTGKRSAMLWALSGVHGADPDAVLEACFDEGCDVSAIVDRLGSRA